jgi:hypothetical protein
MMAKTEVETKSIGQTSHETANSSHRTAALLPVGTTTILRVLKSRASHFLCPSLMPLCTDVDRQV